ncbi:hypothetical protein SRABI04_04094 [Chryseobacterium sp. Bi04]|nr:hypothetical protein SRABI04_04094 [Chryseobacterium sp. Bi04]
MLPLIDNHSEIFNANKFPDIDKLENVNKKTDSGFIEIMKNKTNISYKFTPNNSLFKIVKVYYLNNIIQTKGITLNLPWSTFLKGTWYEFDEKGNLIKEVDYDKPYKFSFEDILKFCMKEGIPLTKGLVLQSTGFHTIITRRIENEKPIWEIEWLKKPSLVENIILDGISGKEISRKESKFTNN